MQDIIFYAAAGETTGLVRDQANARKKSAPILTLGVSVCLRMRLFTDIKVATPYPIDSFDSITDWQWSMDSDFDRDTACKLVADAGGISVHTVSDTVNGETVNFTEFVIPISNMNTEELAAWLGNEKMKSGLTGELVGYDSSGNAAFVLQIEDFSVRNRVAGLGDPTVLDQEILTRTQTEHMIQTAVSSSAATKQDKLTSANAGTGISITGSGIISTADVPQSAVSGLSETLAAKQNNITAGYRMALVSGSTVEQARYFTIEPAITAPPNNTTTVVLSAGKAYEIHAVANNARVLLNRESPPSTRTFGLEGHAEIFVANTGYIQTGANVVLANALEPDSVNNCTVRFHDGLAIISVEDHVAGYIVTVTSGTAAGSLYYGLATATNEYVAVDAFLNGSTIDFAGAATNGEKHIVGNGRSDSIISGGINCTGKTTVANLSLDGVTVSGGTITLGDVLIPSGSTVSAAGGAIVVEHASLDGTLAYATVLSDGTVSGGGTMNAISGVKPLQQFGQNMTLSGITISGYSESANGLLYAGGGNGIVLKDVTVKDFSGYSTIFLNGSASVAMLIDGCSFAEDSTSEHVELYLASSDSKIRLAGCTFASAKKIAGAGTVDAEGENHFRNLISGTSMKVGFASGATVDLTGNTHSAPIVPGGGISFAGANRIVYGESGATTTAYIDGGTFAQIHSGGVLSCVSRSVIVDSGVWSAANVVFTRAEAGADVIGVTDGTASLTSVGCGTAGNGRFVGITGGTVVLSGCSTGTGAAVSFYGSSGTLSLVGSNFIGRGVGHGTNNSGNITIAEGATINQSGAFLAIDPGGTITFGANVTVINAAGSSVSLNGGSSGTCSKININGTIE